MKRISYAMLKRAGACEDRHKFAELFCEGKRTGCAVYPTKEKVLIAIEAGLDIRWFVDVFFSGAQLEAYAQAQVSALEAYEQAIAPAKEAYEQAIADAGKAYEQAIADALEAFRQVVAPAREAYEQARALAGKAYEQAVADAFIAAWSIE